MYLHVNLNKPIRVYFQQKCTHYILIWGLHTNTVTRTHMYTCLKALFQDYPGKPVPERQNQSRFYWRKRQWEAVASAGLYASLHLAPASTPPLSFLLRGWMPFLPPNQQSQSNEGKRTTKVNIANQSWAHSPGVLLATTYTSLCKYAPNHVPPNVCSTKQATRQLFRYHNFSQEPHNETYSNAI